MTAASLRLDRLLWFLRLAPSRNLAQKWVEAGHMRCNGARCEKANKPIYAGDVLTLPMRSHVMTIRILALPAHRGPAAEAQACYQRLDDIITTP